MQKKAASLKTRESHAARAPQCLTNDPQLSPQVMHAAWQTFHNLSKTGSTRPILVCVGIHQR